MSNEVLAKVRVDSSIGVSSRSNVSRETSMSSGASSLV